MLERIEQVLILNELSYTSSTNIVDIKLGGLASNITIHYNQSTNSYECNSRETFSAFNALFFFMLTIHFLWNIDNEPSNLLVASGFFFCSASHALSLIITQIKLLDLKAQLREVGIYLVNKRTKYQLPY